MAYNWGARARAQGYDLGAIVPLGNLPPEPGLSPGEMDALGRLGPDEWQRWTVRGWSETRPPEAMG